MSKSRVITHDLIARLFVQQHCEAIRFDETRAQWFTWNGFLWLPNTSQVTELIRSFCRRMARSRSDNDKRRLESASFINQVRALAQTDPAVLVRGAVWDKGPMLLGTPGGTIDLRTGELRRACSEDMITKSTAVSPSEDDDCPRFKAFLHEITGGDDEYAAFFIRWFGYCLTGVTKEQKLLFLHGPGGNGKGVLTQTIGAILGDYATVASMTTFAARTFDNHPEELAALDGSRLVTASETEFGKQWAEARIKELTGGDPISCRRLYGHRYSYVPSFKLTFAGNHPPMLREVDPAIQRRVLLAFLGHIPSEEDSCLHAKLLHEAPGILRLLIKGCREWQQAGLQIPTAIGTTTAEYLAAQDMFSEWLSERVEFVDDSGVYTPSVDLYNDWAWSAETRGEKPDTIRGFADRMRRATGRKAAQIKAINKKGYLGVRLRQSR